MFFALIVGFGEKTIATEKPKEWGLPIYSTYSFDEIGVAMPDGRLWQDSQGRICIFAGGNYRVFDGKNWENLLDRETSRQYLTSAKVGQNGREYAGWIGSWGYLVDSKGRNKERFSITPPNAPEWTRNSRFLEIIELEDSVLYIGDLGAVIYAPSTNEHRYIPCALFNRMGFELNGHAYAASDQIGLTMFDGSNFVVVAGAESFCQRKCFIDGCPLNENEMLLATVQDGMFIFDGKDIRKFETEINDLVANGITAIEVLPDGRIVVAISNMGLFVLFPDGAIQIALEREYTTEFANVGDLMRTPEGVLWATINNGVAKIYLENGITLFDHRMGLPLFWPYVSRQGNTLYIRTQNDIYKSVYDDTGRLVRFEMLDLPGLDSGISSVVAHSRGLVISCTRGVFLWTVDERLIPIIEEENIIRVVGNPSNPDQVMVFAGNYDTLIEYRDGSFTEVSQRHPSIGFPSTIVPEEGGRFWVELGVGRFALAEIEGNDFSQQVFANVPILPHNWINIWKIDNEVYFSSDQKMIVRYNRKTGGFDIATDMQSFWQQFQVDISRPRKDEDGVIWLPHRDGIDRLIPEEDGDYRYDSISMNAYKGNNPKFTFDDGRIWFVSENQLAVYDKTMETASVEEPRPIIYSVISMDSGNSILNPLNKDQSYARVIPYSNNSLTFYICPSNYALSRAPTYRYKLEGLSKDWSQPSTDSSISFTNLPEGNYSLWIEMRGQSGPIGKPVEFRFSVQPPLYRTWYAYLIYVGLVYLALLLIVRKFLKRAEKEKTRLERLVTERTKALDRTNDRLRLALRSAENAAEAKSQFLANMSHEIRTPMNGVIGTVQLLKESELTEDQNELLSMIDRSGNLLLHIINDILDFSKAEAGKIELESVEFDLEEMVEGVLDILSSRIAESDSRFITSLDTALPRRCLGDPVRLQQVLINFCSNAIKFTKNGLITLRIGGSAYANEDNTWNVGFEVQDTGIGIPKEKMDNLFTPFSQLDASNARIFGGTGLGLAISDRLVKLMGSAIQVKSEAGKGSSFGFKLKLKCPPNAGPIVATKREHPHAIWIVDDCRHQVIEIAENLEAMGFSSIKNLTADQVEKKLLANETPDLVLIGDPLEDLDRVHVFLKNAKAETRIICYGFHPDWKSMDSSILWMNQPLKLSRLRAKISSILNLTADTLPTDKRNGSLETLEVDDSKSILIVEDSPTNRRVLELMLKRFHLEMDFAQDGKEALDVVSNKDYALILMDIQLPGMDGIEITRRIRNMLPEEKQPTIVGVSANVMQQDITKAKEAGMDEYIFKPIRIAELHKLIAKYLGV